MLLLVRARRGKEKIKSQLPQSKKSATMVQRTVLKKRSKTEFQQMVNTALWVWMEKSRMKLRKVTRSVLFQIEVCSVNLPRMQEGSDGLKDIHRTSIPKRIVWKKDLAKDILLMFSEITTVVFKYPNSPSETLKGRWCSECW